MTQTVWGDDICPVRTDRERRRRRKKKERERERERSVRAGLLKAASQNIMLQPNREMGGETYGLSQR